jgi:hypothetical protein
MKSKARRDYQRVSLMKIRFILLVVGCLIPSLAVNAQFVDTTRIKADPLGHDEWVTQVLSAPMSKELVSAGVDGRIVFWDAASGKLLREVAVRSPVMTISLSGDGRTLAAGDSSGMVSVIDVETAKVKAALRADKQIINAVAWSSDGKVFAAGGSEGIVRVASADGKVTTEINPAHGDVMALSFAKGQLVIGLRDGKDHKRSAELWDVESKRQIRTFDEGPAGMRGTSVSPDGQLLAIADYEQPTLLTMTPTSGSGAEVSLRVLPESDAGTPVAIWDISSGKRVALINAETGARSIVFSPDGQMLATAGPNGVMISEVGAGTFAEVGRIDSQTSVDAITFTADSKKILLSREREPLARFGSGGIDKLVDPFFTSLVMQVRQGLTTGVLSNLSSTPIGAPTKKNTQSVTGGSSIEIWQINQRSSPADMKTWEAVRKAFAGKADEAQRLLQAVVQDNPGYGEARRLSAVLFGSKDITKLEGALQAAVKGDPSCVSCWRSLGEIQHKLEHYPDAVNSYDHALQLKPEYGLVSGRKAEAFAAMAMQLMSSENNDKNMDAAKQALTNALMLRPGVEQYYTNLGAAYYFRGDFDKDIELLLIARRLRPDHARIYYNLGHAYRYKGDKQHAIEAYQQYVLMGEEGEEARVEKAKDFIKQLSR